MRLDAALGQLKPATAGFGAADLLYGTRAGAVQNWGKFWNSLKLTRGLILADKDPGKAKAAEDNSRFPYLASPPNNNPIASATNPALISRTDYIGARPFIDKLNALSDPRRPGFFTTVGVRLLVLLWVLYFSWQLLYDNAKDCLVGF